MYGVHQAPRDDYKRLLKPARVVKWYREITDLDPNTPLPTHVSYKQMLRVVLSHENSDDGGEVER